MRNVSRFHTGPPSDNDFNDAMIRRDIVFVRAALYRGYATMSMIHHCLSMYGNVEMLRVFVEFGCLSNSHYLWYAILVDDEETFDDMINRNCEIDADYLSLAIGRGRQQMFDALMSKGCPMSRKLIVEALECNNFYAVEKLRAAGCPE